MSQNEEKKMTNYDRKVMAREAAEKKAKQKSILTVVATVAILACLIALIISVPVLKHKNKYKEYFRVNDVSVSQMEFNFHKTNLINSNATILAYMGISDLASLYSTVYDEKTGATWNDFFEERTAASIKENIALIADAKAKNISLDIKEDYDMFIEEAQAAADASGVDLDTYFSSTYGATVKDLKNIIEDNLFALAYSEYLAVEMAASDEEAQAEYDANKGEYDSVDYRVLEFPVVTEEGADEATVSAAIADTKAKAQEMLDKVAAGEDFETLCASYALEEDRTDYADETTDKSLVTGKTHLTSYEPYSEWLFEDARTEGETYLYSSEDDLNHYAIQYVKRYMGEDVLGEIKSNLTYYAVTEYIAEISADYVISDPEDNLPAY